MKDEKVNQYIDQLSSPQKEICKGLRNIIHNTFPDIEEKMKWGVPTFGDDQFYIVGLKDHVNLGFSIQDLPQSVIDQLQGSGKTMRVLEIRTEDEIDKGRIIDLMKLVRREQ